MILLDAVVANSRVEAVIRSLIENGSQLGITVVKALIVFLVGRLIINLLNKLCRKILDKRNVDPSVKSFLGSLVNVSLTILLIISVIGALGVQTASFAASMILFVLPLPLGPQMIFTMLNPPAPSEDGYCFLYSTKFSCTFQGDLQNFPEKFYFFFN